MSCQLGTNCLVFISFQHLIYYSLLLCQSLDHLLLQSLPCKRLCFELVFWQAQFCLNNCQVPSFFQEYEKAIQIFISFRILGVAFRILGADLCCHLWTHCFSIITSEIQLFFGNPMLTVLK